MHVVITNPLWRGKRFQHSRHMRNPHCYVSGKRPKVLPFVEKPSSKPMLMYCQLDLLKQKYVSITNQTFSVKLKRRLLSGHHFVYISSCLFTWVSQNLMPHISALVPYLLSIILHRTKLLRKLSSTKPCKCSRH